MLGQIAAVAKRLGGVAAFGDGGQVKNGQGRGHGGGGGLAGIAGRASVRLACDRRNGRICFDCVLPDAFWPGRGFLANRITGASLAYNSLTPSSGGAMLRVMRAAARSADRSRDRPRDTHHPWRHDR